MKDRYLFRGKRVEDDEWMTGFLERLDDQCAMLLDKSGIPLEVDPATVGQCTGLKDSSGKLIHEGDIVKSHIAELPDEDFEIGEIAWIEEKAGFGLINRFGPISIHGCELTVLGNALDSPEAMDWE